MRRPYVKIQYGTFKMTMNRRHNLRLPGYDYSQPGGYFVTMVTQNRICLFGEVRGEEVVLSDIGRIADEYWSGLPGHFQNIELGAFVIMPNHIHGIIIINETVGATHASPLPEKSGPPIGSIGAIIGSFKSAVSRQARQKFGITRLWQRGYYEHILRSEEDWRNIHEYIASNPANWAADVENPLPAP